MIRRLFHIALLACGLASFSFSQSSGELRSSLRSDAQTFDAIEAPGSLPDAGRSLESEMMWFNQVPSAPLPAYKKAWFASQDFRRAVSEAIHRDELCKLVSSGHAEPAAGLVSPGDRCWVSTSLAPHRYDLASAQRRLEHAGFLRVGGTLYDRDGHPVDFSLVTSGGNQTRGHIAAMLQQDLLGLGIHLNVVTVDSPSLMDRMTQSFQYEAILLGLANLDLDPSAQIVWEQEPIIYLVTQHKLTAFSANLRNPAPAAVEPQANWNIDQIVKSALLAASR